MKINNISNINFNRNIPYIDMHTHDKPISLLGKNTDASYLTKFMDKQIEVNGDTFVLQKVFPSSLDCCFYENGKPYLDEIKGNENIIKTFENTNIHEFLATCQPKTGNVKNIKNLFKNNKNNFIGLKFHPEGMELEADNTLYDAYLKFAKKHNLPCVFHSNNGKDYVHPTENWKVAKSEFSRPEQIYSLAKRHPDVPIVMAHCGGCGDINVEEAINTIIDSAKNNNSKLYADISWVDIDVIDKATSKREMPNLINAIKKLKNSEAGDLTDRIMFGTDAPIDRFASENADEIYTNYIKDIHSSIKKNFGSDADDIIDKIFYKNADNLFFKKTWVKPVSTNNIATSGKKVFAIASLGIAAIGALCTCGIKHHSANKTKSANQENSKTTIV